MKREIKTAIDTSSKTEENVYSLRPRTLDECIGQDKIKESIKILIKSAKIRKEQPGHILFYGPPGLGKTTFANVIATELKCPIVSTVGSNLEKPADVAALLNSINEKTIVFIDEIHRINKVAEECLYSAMEDGFITINIGVAEQAKAVKLSLPKFTLIGATTRAGMLSNPLRDRFVYQYKMELYGDEDLKRIASITSEKLGIQLTSEQCFEIASVSRGTPRLVNKYCILTRDYAFSESDGKICDNTIKNTLSLANVNEGGLSDLDVLLLQTLSEIGKPVGLSTLSHILNEDPQTIEDVYEPYLLLKKMIIKTPRGREITELGLNYLRETEAKYE